LNRELALKLREKENNTKKERIRKVKQKEYETIYAITHPGATLKQLLNQKNMSQRELAVRTGLTEAYLSSLINCKKPLSVGTAKKMEYALGYTAESWLNVQAQHDLTIYKLEEQNSITVKERNILKKLEQITVFMQEKELLSQNSDHVRLVLELRQKMKVANLTAIPESMQSSLYDKPGKLNNPYLYYSCLGLCEYITSQVTGITPFDQDKLKNELPCLEELLATHADLQEIKKNLTVPGISLFGLPRFSELELQGYATMTLEASLALFIFEQGSSQAQRNDSLLQCLKSIAVGQVNSKRVFNRCKKK